MRLGKEESSPGLRRRYLQAASDFLFRYWSERAAGQGVSLVKPQLLFEGERLSGCGGAEVKHPTALYCTKSQEIAMALDLRRAVKAARGLGEQELLSMDLAVLAHEWGHHANRSLGLGPYKSGFSLTVKQEELAADWRTGQVLGSLLGYGAMDIDGFTRSANLMFELGDYEFIAPGHHGYPKERFEALAAGLAKELTPGQRLGTWSFDTRETFSRPLADSGNGEFLATGRKLYEVQRFEIDRTNQVATNLIGGVLGAMSCIWGSRDQCLGMAMQQGKGRAYGRYVSARLSLDCISGRFDVTEDGFEAQPIDRDGKRQAALLAQRDCQP
ncbi:zinc peptidase [Cyanobium sp. HWJ4-Hawea]|nr:zinc peptidase [Cyanobium sp. HWJ4-Hawea]